MAKDALTMDGYVRQSRAPKDGEGISPEQQEERIRSWAESRGVTLPRIEHDIDQTGAKLARPGLDRIMVRIEAGETGGIIVAKLDRLSRAGLIDALKLIERIHEAGGQFASDDFGLDPTTKEGELVLGFMLGLARWEWRRLAEGWSDAKARAVERGVLIGPTPIGYVRNADSTLKPDPVYGPMITEIFTRASRDQTDSEIAKWARAKHPAKDRAPWAISEIRRWLRNRVYLGEVKHGDLVKANAHEPLTDSVTFGNAQREPGVQRKNLSEPFPLSGVARCATCRYAMTGQSNAGQNGATRVYRCSHSGRGDGREHSVIVADRLEAFVKSETLARIDALSDDEHARLIEPGDPASLAALETRVAEAEDAERVLGAATDPEADWLADARAQAELLPDLRVERDEAAERMRVGEGLLARWVWVRRGRGQKAKDRVKITWLDDPPVDVPGPHKSGPFEPVEW